MAADADSLASFPAFTSVILGRHSCIFLKLPQEGIAAADTYHSAYLADLDIRILHQLHGFLNAVKLDAVAEIHAGFAFVVGA